MAWGGKGGWHGDDGGPWGRPSGSGPRPDPEIPPRRQPGGGRPQGPDFEDLFEKLNERLRRMYSGGGDKRGILLLLLGMFLLWMASGIFIVSPDEQGVVLRFGKYYRTTQPGPNYHLPYPIETVEKPKVTTINRIEVGVDSSRGSYRGEQSSIPAESLMLTGDENIVDINAEVQWKIGDAQKFLFNVRNPEQTVKSVAESALREVVGRSDIGTILSEGRLKLELNTKDLMQETLDHYASGIEIVSVNMLKADPPGAVIDAFRDVQAAKADQESARNEAEAYRNDIIPKARGEAEKMILDAEAYKQEVVARAKGDTARFLSVYEEFRKAKDVTKRRMYLETMEQILEGMDKIIMENKGGSGVVPYLPLPDLRKQETE